MVGRVVYIPGIPPMVGR